MGGLRECPPIVLSAGGSGAALTARVSRAYNLVPSVSEWRNW